MLGSFQISQVCTPSGAYRVAAAMANCAKAALLAGGQASRDLHAVWRAQYGGSSRIAAIFQPPVLAPGNIRSNLCQLVWVGAAPSNTSHGQFGRKHPGPT